MVLIKQKKSLILNGTDQDGTDVVYWINGLPKVYTFDQLERELPTRQEIEDKNFDYIEAIYQRIRGLPDGKVLMVSFLKLKLIKMIFLF